MSESARDLIESAAEAQRPRTAITLREGEIQVFEPFDEVYAALEDAVELVPLTRYQPASGHARVAIAPWAVVCIFEITPARHEQVQARAAERRAAARERHESGVRGARIQNVVEDDYPPRG